MIEVEEMMIAPRVSIPLLLRKTASSLLGRIPTETCSRLCDLIGGVNVPGVEVFVRPVKDYRATIRVRKSG